MYACIKTCSHKHVCTWISCLFLCGKFQVESWALSSVSSLTNDHTCLTIVVQKLVPCHSSGQTGQQLDYGSGEMWRRHQPDDVVFFSCHVCYPQSVQVAFFLLFEIPGVSSRQERGNPFSRHPEALALRLDAKTKAVSARTGWVTAMGFALFEMRDDGNKGRPIEAVSSQVLWVVN